MLNVDHYLNNGLTEDDDYVGLLQQWNQKENGEVPDYEFEETRDGTFITYVEINTKRGSLRYIRGRQ